MPGHKRGDQNREDQKRERQCCEKVWVQTDESIYGEEGKRVRVLLPGEETKKPCLEDEDHAYSRIKSPKIGGHCGQVKGRPFREDIGIERSGWIIVLGGLVLSWDHLLEQSGEPLASEEGISKDNGVWAYFSSSRSCMLFPLSLLGLHDKWSLRPEDLLFGGSGTSRPSPVTLRSSP